MKGGTWNTTLIMRWSDGRQLEHPSPLPHPGVLPNFQLFSAHQLPVDLKPQGEDKQSPVARLTFKSEGNYLLAMERDAAMIKLDAQKFTDYLTEGLDSVVSLRARSNETGKEGRERYRRYLKALFQAGDRHDDTYKRALKQRLEIFPQTNPYTLKLGDILKVRILFESKPLVEAKVFAYNQRGDSSDSHVHEQSARTANDGSVSFKLDRSGDWLIRLVHMRRCASDCTEIDWESFWALTPSA